jgi:hypothetical protein
MHYYLGHCHLKQQLRVTMEGVCTGICNYRFLSLTSLHWCPRDGSSSSIPGMGIVIASGGRACFSTSSWPTGGGIAYLVLADKRCNFQGGVANYNSNCRSVAGSCTVDLSSTAGRWGPRREYMCSSRVVHDGGLIPPRDIVVNIGQPVLSTPAVCFSLRPAMIWTLRLCSDHLQGHFGYLLLPVSGRLYCSDDDDGKSVLKRPHPHAHSLGPADHPIRPTN